MQIAVLDTNILIHYFKNSPLVTRLRSFLEEHTLTSVISVVTKAELIAIAKRNNWGDKKLSDLNMLLADFAYSDIEYNNTELLNAYASIDAFSQGKAPAPNGQMLNNSSRNMGKNDLWIAAATHALEATLLTTDGDFDHLKDVYFKLKKF